MRWFSPYSTMSLSSSEITGSQSSSSSSSSSSSTLSVAEDLRTLNNQIRAKIVSDALKKGAIGAISGAAFSFLIFRRKQMNNFIFVFII